MKTIDFYFDFGSPYSYVAYKRLQQLQQNITFDIQYYPVILGGIFKATNNQSPVMVPAKAKYLFKDLNDWSKYWQIPFQFNPHFPINTFLLMRAAIGYQAKYPEQLSKFIEVFFDAMFKQPVNLNLEEQIINTLQQAGFVVEDYQRLIQDEDIKALAKTKTENAVKRGLFGVPAFFIDDEMFWGQDRLHFIEQKLQAG